MSPSNLAGSFSPYTPPPDDPFRLKPEPASRLKIWFSESHPSYQSGGLPLTSSTATSVATSTDNGRESTYGIRVDVLAAFAYLLGPISAFILLVLETRNDYVRFHAYQSALLMTPLLGAHILATILQPPLWIRYFITFSLCLSGFLMATQAFLGASGGELSRYQFPKLGSLADKWVEEE